MDPSPWLQWHRSAADIPASAWATCFPPPLEGLWWYLALERSGLDDQFKFAYATLGLGDRIVAIAPTFLMDMSFRMVVPEGIWPWVQWLGRLHGGLLAQRVLFVGSPCSEHGTIGLTQGTSLEDVLPPLQTALDAHAEQAGARMVVWKDVAEPAASVLRTFAAQAGLFEVTSFPGTVLRISGSSYESYLQGLPGRRRYKVRRRVAASRAAIHLRVEDLKAPDARTRAAIYRLYLLNYNRATVRFEKLTETFFREIAESEPARFLLLIDEDTGTPVAFMLYFMIGGCAINKFIGIDLDFHPEAYLYFRLWQEFLMRATRLGATDVSSGQTAYRVKFDLGHELVPLANFSKHFNPLLHRIYGAVGRTVTLATLDPDLRTALEARRPVGGSA